MTLHWSTTATQDQAVGIKALIYGRSGAGKTTLAATCERPLILNAEAGLLSLRRYNIPAVAIKTLADLEEALVMLNTPQAMQQFRTVFLDSVTEIGELILSQAKASVKDPRQAYGELLEKATKLIKQFRDLPYYNVVMLAKVEPVKDELTGVVRFGPSMPGSKLGPQLPYLFDEVFHLGIGKTPEGVQYRYIQTQPDIQFDAKDRSGLLAPIEPPDLSVIFSKIQGA